MAVLAGMVLRVQLHGGVATGADYVTVDQLQYLNWIRQASDHGAVQNLYDLSESPRSFVHPACCSRAFCTASAWGSWPPSRC